MTTSERPEMFQIPSWTTLEAHFNSKRLHIARYLLENGVSVKNGSLYVNNIPIHVSSIAKSLQVDRRSVLSVVKQIEQNAKLKLLFRSLRARPSLDAIAKCQGLIELVCNSDESVHALTRAISVINRHRINLRSVVASDTTLGQDPIILILLDPVPHGVLEELSSIRGVKRLTYHTPRRELE